MHGKNELSNLTNELDDLLQNTDDDKEFDNFYKMDFENYRKECK